MDIQREPQREPQRPSTQPNRQIPPVQSSNSQSATGTNRTFVPFIRSYARETSVVVGVLTIVMGLLGFVVPNLLGAHLSYVHNSILIATGALALWFGTDSERSAKAFSLVAAVCFGIMGILGFVLGVPGIGTVANTAEDANLWTIVTGSLQFGTVDHVIHLLIACAFLGGALMKQKEYRSL